MEIQSVVDEGLAEGHMLNLQLKSFLNSMYAFYHSGMSLTEAAAQAEQTQASDNYVSLERIFARSARKRSTKCGLPLRQPRDEPLPV